MPTINGRFATPNASALLRKLCKHFSHKVKCEFTETYGHCDMPMGPLELIANESELIAKFTTDSHDGIARGKYIVDSHLVNMARKEGFESMDWSTLDSK